jgi:hypothetical protein
MDGEVARSSGNLRAGTPLPGTTDAAGRFTYPGKPKRPGTFILEVLDDMVARNAGAPLAEAKGPIVCKRLASDADSFDVVIVARAVADIVPSIEMPRLDGAPSTGAPTDRALIVRRPHTRPARRPIVFRAAPDFNGTGEVTIAQGATRIRLFDAVVGGNAIRFDGADNVFPAPSLRAGVTLFAEGGPDPSDQLDDVIVQMQLTVGGTPGRSATLAITAVAVTLEVGLSRPAGGGDPPLLSAADKIGTGRFTQVRDPNLGHERTLIRARPPQPAVFAGELSITPTSASIAIFAEEVPAAGQAALPTPLVIPAAGIPATGVDRFVEGLDHSAAPRDVGLQLGIRDLDPDGDRVNLTLVRLDFAADDAPATAASTVARFGAWDQAYDAAGEFVADIIANDERRMHFRVRDAGAPPGTLTTQWVTTRANRVATDDAPADQRLTLTESAAGSHHFISRGVMLVTVDLDARLEVPSGLPADPGRREPRRRGESDHRMRRGAIDGFVRNTYSPAAQPGTRLQIVAPIFRRDPEERRRLAFQVIRYTSVDPRYVQATDARIAAQLGRAQDAWRQVGLLLVPGATTDRPIPAAALDAGHYGGSANNAFEQAALLDLIPITPDNTLAVVFADLDGANAYATVATRNPIPNPPGPDVTIGDRYFIFVDTELDANNETLAHELHHVLFNRFDDGVGDQFFAFNTQPPTALALARGIALPDARIYRRIQNLHAADPDIDPTNDNILNWVRRARAARQPALAGPGTAANAATGNNLVRVF